MILHDYSLLKLWVFILVDLLAVFFPYLENDTEAMSIIGETRDKSLP